MLYITQQVFQGNNRVPKNLEYITTQQRKAFPLITYSGNFHINEGDLLSENPSLLFSHSSLVFEFLMKVIPFQTMHEKMRDHCHAKGLLRSH